jgi:hypothetical protein
MVYLNYSLLPVGGLPAVRADSAPQRSLSLGEPAAPDLPDAGGDRQPAYPPHPAQKVRAGGGH